MTIDVSTGADVEEQLTTIEDVLSLKLLLVKQFVLEVQTTEEPVRLLLS